MEKQNIEKHVHFGDVTINAISTYRTNPAAANPDEPHLGCIEIKYASTTSINKSAIIDAIRARLDGWKNPEDSGLDIEDRQGATISITGIKAEELGIITMATLDELKHQNALSINEVNKAVKELEISNAERAGVRPKSSMPAALRYRPNSGNNSR